MSMGPIHTCHCKSHSFRSSFRSRRPIRPVALPSSPRLVPGAHGLLVLASDRLHSRLVGLTPVVRIVFRANG